MRSLGTPVAGVSRWVWGGVVAVVLGIAAIGDGVAGQPAQSADRKDAAASKDADDAHRRQDIERHRQMAAAHQAAAACLESGRSEKACHEALRDACKGLAVGRYCGMRHAH